MNKYFNIILKQIGSMAVFMMMLSANTTSGWIAHQPEIPKGIKKFKR